MVYRIVHEITSTKYPEKTWDTVEDFWADHAEEDGPVDALLDSLEAENKLLVNEFLSDSKEIVVLVKDFKSKTIYDDFINSNSHLIGGVESHYNFNPLFKGVSDSETEEILKKRYDTPGYWNFGELN